MTFKAFQSIEQFRTVIKKVQQKTRFAGLDAEGTATYDHAKRLPVLRYKGTVKLHGTNACIHLLPGEIKYQSRNIEIDSESDNAGFVHEMSQKPLDDLRSFFAEDDDVYIYGEWCGKGIQRGVGVTELDKMFVIFDVRVNDVRFLDIANISLPSHRIFNINNFQTYEALIDFNEPEAIQNQLIEFTTLVELKCPVAAHFGVDGVGEGVVWRLNESTDKFEAGDSDLTFKVKGEKHSVTNVKVLAAVDVEKVASIKEFVSKVVTDNRCRQGLDYLREMKLEISVRSTGDFVRWVFNDVAKEESDVVDESGLDKKELGACVSKAAKAWYFDNI